MFDINAFLTCPKCHRMYEERVLKCELPCGFEHPVPEAAPIVEEVKIDQTNG